MCIKRFALASLAVFTFPASAMALPTGLSSSRVILVQDRVYRVAIGMLATDLERIFSASMSERSGIDLSQNGVLETEIGKLVQRRISIGNAGGQACSSRVEFAGEDPADATGALVTLTFDCKKVGGKLFYDASKLVSAHGADAKQWLISGEGSNTGQLMLVATGARVDISSELPASAYESVDPKDLELGPRKFMGKTLKMSDMQCFYADLNEYRCWSPRAHLTIFARTIADHAEKAKFDELCGKSKNSTEAICRRTILLVPSKWDSDQPSAFGRRTLIAVDELRFVQEKTSGR